MPELSHVADTCYMMPKSAEATAKPARRVIKHPGAPQVGFDGHDNNYPYQGMYINSHS